MGQGPRQEGHSPYMLKVYLSLAFFLILIENTSGVSHCRVNFCSRKYTHAVEHQHIISGPNYRYCHLLQNYFECIEATAKKCRGDLDFHYTQSYVAKRITQNNCSSVLAQGPGASSHPPSSTEQTPRQRPFPEECSYRGSTSKYNHCGVFGDPHLKTFLNEFQTCKAAGAWPLIDNPYLAVQVTNEKVSPVLDATATSKVTIIVKDHSPCTTEKTYEAQTNDLPGYFVDGSKTSGPSYDVRIYEEDPGAHIEITIRHIDTRIIIRQVGSYLSFAIRMPQEVAMLGSSGESLELCAKGCPKREMIDPNQIFSQATPRTRVVNAYTLQSAESACRFHNVTDFYFDACVFDLLTTGNDTFIYASRHAMRDAIALGHTFSTGSHRTQIPVIPKNGDKFRAIENGAPGRPWVFAILVILASFANQIGLWI